MERSNIAAPNETGVSSDQYFMKPPRKALGLCLACTDDFAASRRTSEYAKNGVALNSVTSALQTRLSLCHTRAVHTLCEY